MANDNYYDVRNHLLCWLGPEVAVRQNAQGADAINLVTDTFFRLPGRLLKIPFMYIKRNKVYRRIANQKFWGYLGHEGFQEGKMTLTMDMIDLSMLHYLTKASTTAGAYTHTYATTTAQTSPPPTFQMLYKLVNYEGGNDIITLFMGCTLSGVAISIPLEGPIQLTLDIKFAKVRTGAPLNDYPAFGTLVNYTRDYTELTIKKAGTEYPGTIRTVDIVYLDGTVLHKPSNNEYATEAINGNPDIQVRIAFAPKDATYAADTLTAPLAPEAASNIDIFIKMKRGDGSVYYTSFDFQNVWCIDSGDGTWDFEIETAIMMQHTNTFVIKPEAYEADAKLTIIDANVFDATRYET